MPLPLLFPPSLLAAVAVPGGAEWGAIAGAYLLGAVPFGLVMARVLKGVDLRTVGSGNIGATNAMRVLGRPLGLVAFALDFLKGWLPVFALAPAAALAPERVTGLQVLCGAAAVLGHCFPVYLRFRGGKGVATGCGALVALDPVVFLVGGAAWLVALAATRYVGVASMVMGLGFCAAALVRGPGELLAGAVLLEVLILVRHRSNIERLLAGTEPRIGAGRRGGEADAGSG